MINMTCDWLDGRENLQPRSTIANQGDLFPIQVKGMVPIGRMKKCSLIVLYTLVIRQSPSIKVAYGIDEDV